MCIFSRETVIGQKDKKKSEFLIFKKPWREMRNFFQRLQNFPYEHGRSKYIEKSKIKKSTRIRTLYSIRFLTLLYTAEEISSYFKVIPSDY